MTKLNFSDFSLFLQISKQPKMESSSTWDIFLDLLEKMISLWESRDWSLNGKLKSLVFEVSEELPYSEVDPDYFFLVASSIIDWTMLWTESWISIIFWWWVLHWRLVFVCTCWDILSKNLCGNLFVRVSSIFPS